MIDWADSLQRFGPIAIVLITAIVVLAADLLTRRKEVLAGLAVAGLALSAAYSIQLIVSDEQGPAFADTLVLDDFAAFFQILFAGAAAVVILSSTGYAERLRVGGEYLALILTATAGMMLMASTTDLLAIYISLELTSVSLYVLTALSRDERSAEAGLKYLLMGAVSSSVVLYGMAFLFGATGSTSLEGIGEAIATDYEGIEFAVILGVVFLVGGFAFKLSTIPFQMWTPDVYEGAPTPVAALLSVGSKAAGFAMLLRVFYTAFADAEVAADWEILVAGIAAVSMVIGNFLALPQTNIKRLLGYSSIAQAGNIMVGVAAVGAGNDEFAIGAAGTIFFLASYAFTNLGAFIAVIAISNRLGSDSISDYAGLGRTWPLPAAALALCLLSLTGLPPTVGFWAKLYIFNAAAQAELWWLVLIAVGNTAVAAFYYLGIVAQMYLKEGPEREERRPALGLPLGVSIAATTLGVFVFGLVPGPLIEAAESAAAVFAG
ncbi:MAG: NADH-quinone oxidoreductase subunit NuoN [Dehalococcoidia bacterium]|nr:NADH-quinone oxidoreductase subunit NuoN [Dehalococcoidia bacterium]